MTNAYLPESEPRLRALLGGVRCLLLDFDGPLCDLFHLYDAEAIAARMHGHLARTGREFDDPALAAGGDPHQLLYSARGGLARELEAILAEGEELAAYTAEPTPLAADFVRAAADAGMLLAITTNNAPAAVVAYLRKHGLEDFFGDRVFGRDTDDPRRMKPDPHCLDRAVETLGVRPADCLMIGDSERDAAAATAARVPFLGYARDAGRVAVLRARAPHPVALGMADLLAAATALAHPKE